MTEKGWWLLSAVWFLALGAGWSAYYSQETTVKIDDLRMARWHQTIQLVNRVMPRKTEDNISVSEGGLMEMVQKLAFDRSTHRARAKARAIIAHRLTQFGYTPELQSFTHGINIIAQSGGTIHEAPTLVLGAHYDTVANSPGADDNATGVAGVLEIARLLKTTKHRLNVVLAFFDAEEDGLLGSAAYLASSGRRENICGAIILEMIGYQCRTDGCQKSVKGVPSIPKNGDFLAVISDIKQPQLLMSFARSTHPKGLKTYLLPVFDGGWPLMQTRRSDHAQFWDRGIGAVMVTDTADFRNPHYHQPTDTPHTLSSVFLAQSTEFVWRSMLHFMDDVAIH